MDGRIFAEGPTEPRPAEGEHDLSINSEKASIQFIPFI